MKFEEKYRLLTRLTTSNDGKIVRPEELDLVFDKGYTGSNTTDGATGFGLYYSSLIAHKLNYNCNNWQQSKKLPCNLSR